MGGATPGDGDPLSPLSTSSSSSFFRNSSTDSSSSSERPSAFTLGRQNLDGQLQLKRRSYLKSLGCNNIFRQKLLLHPSTCYMWEKKTSWYSSFCSLRRLDVFRCILYLGKRSRLQARVISLEIPKVLTDENGMICSSSQVL
uniref:Uncharacterized protein LOC105058858 n=1 Tax=Elaeis guineensis var. tenera TaxID=51953 RepID=A0A6I9SA52_ELAGV|nr:uncharacterized protein LOC105058858 [Elaeis guineensis]